MVVGNKNLVPEHADRDKTVTNRKQITAFVICFNEEEHITDCLQSVAFCDEIIAIDSFSTDRTVELAEQSGAKVLQRKWSGYRDQKAFGLSQANHEWVLNIDADERVSPELRDSIEEILKKDYTGEPSVAGCDGFYVNRVVYFLGRWWRNGGWYPEYRLRLVRKSKTKWGGTEPHERPEVAGKTGRLQGEMHHYSFRDIDERLLQSQKFSTIAAREEYALGKRATVFSLFVNPLVRVVKFYFLKRGYREGVAGLVVAIIEGYYTFMKYAKLWEHEFRAQEERKVNKRNKGSQE